MSRKSPNKNRKPREAEEYFFTAYVNDDGEVDFLLLTPNELAVAKRRAGRNPEDIPQDFIIVQGCKDSK